MSLLREVPGPHLGDLKGRVWLSEQGLDCELPYKPGVWAGRLNGWAQFGLPTECLSKWLAHPASMAAPGHLNFLHGSGLRSEHSSKCCLLHPASLLLYSGVEAVTHLPRPNERKQTPTLCLLKKVWPCFRTATGTID